MKIEYYLELSPFKGTIKEQLEEQRCYMTKKNYEFYEDLRRSLFMVGFHLATESEMKRNSEKLLNKIQKDVNNGIGMIEIKTPDKDREIGELYINSENRTFEVIAKEKTDNKEYLIVEELK